MILADLNLGLGAEAAFASAECLASATSLSNIVGDEAGRLIEL